jgi:diguanylate cyclase (GGDEF)-like protein
MAVMTSATGRRATDDGPLDRFFVLLAGGISPDQPELRDQMLALLLRWRLGVVTASAASLVVWVAAYYTTGAHWALGFIAADCALCAGKWWISGGTGLKDPHGRARAVGWLMLLALVWATLLGVGIAICIAGESAGLATLAVGVGAATIGVATFRNAPTPRHAMILVLCVVVPPAISAQFYATGAISLLGLCLIPWCICLYFMIRQNFEVIRGASTIRLDLHKAARTDALTGLGNRLAFNEHFRRVTRMGAGQGVTFLYLDLDRFKQVNDSHGHEAGDVLLAEVAKRIRKAVRRKDDVFRLGGDEFAVVIEQLPPDELQRTVDRVIAAICRPVAVAHGVKLRVGVSIGSATLTGGEEAVDEVLRAADAALYRAKAMGRGGHVRADVPMMTAH